jgi:hypothetical protein
MGATVSGYRSSDEIAFNRENDACEGVQFNAVD